MSSGEKHGFRFVCFHCPAVLSNMEIQLGVIAQIFIINFEMLSSYVDVSDWAVMKKQDFLCAADA